MTIINSDIYFQGELNFDEEMEIHGQLEGLIRSSTKLIIANKGNIQGEIYANQIEIHGNVSGNIHCEGAVKIHENGKVNGDIRCKELMVLSGSQINGCIVME